MPERDDLPMTTGEALRARRESVGLTQHELAERAGLSVRAVRNVETESAGRPRPETLRRIAAVLDQPPEHLRIEVLGPLRVWLGGRPVDIRAPKLRSLIGLLALRPHDVVPQAEVVDLLWDDHPPRTCLNLVHGYVMRLRTLLEPRRGTRESAQVLVTAAGGYALHPPDPRALDVLVFDRACATARAAGDPHAALAAWSDALACWRGGVLADAEPRLRQHPSAVAVAQKRVSAALAFADVATAVGSAERAVPVLRGLAAEEPLDERLHARLMLGLAGSGQRAAALQVFGAVRDRLAAELGIPPGAELTAVYERVRHEPEPGAAAAATVAEAPLPPAGFVGRRSELARLDRLAGASTRAATVVITGVGGSGKPNLENWLTFNVTYWPDSG